MTLKAPRPKRGHSRNFKRKPPYVRKPKITPPPRHNSSTISDMLALREQDQQLSQAEDDLRRGIRPASEVFSRAAQGLLSHENSRLSRSILNVDLGPLFDAGPFEEFTVPQSLRHVVKDGKIYVHISEHTTLCVQPECEVDPEKLPVLILYIPVKE